jgi:hypothetical protein
VAGKPERKNEIPITISTMIMTLSSRKHPKTGNPGLIRAYFRNNRIFATGQFRGFSGAVSRIIVETDRNHGLTVVGGEKPAGLDEFGQRFADMVNLEYR